MSQNRPPRTPDKGASPGTSRDKTRKGGRMAAQTKSATGDKPALPAWLATSMAPPARAVTLRVLKRCMQHGMDVQHALDSVLCDAPISSQDAALATELVYGYLRSEMRVSWLLGHFLKDPARLPQEALVALGVAAYELVFLDRIPDYASVDWAVSHVRHRFGAGFARVSNAVLRNIARLGDDARTPEYFAQHYADPLAALAVFYAMPRWVVDLWFSSYGECNTVALLAASMGRPASGVRVNALREGAAELRSQLVAMNGMLAGHSGVGFVSGGFPSGLNELVTEGRISRQGIASQETLHALKPETWEGPVWDACCGRGGKACALLEQGVLVTVASDLNQPRLRGFVAELQRLGLPAPVVYRGSADAPALRNAPRTILLDVPCSGLGTLSRRPDIKRKRDPDDLDKLVALQGRMVEAAWAQLPVGGRLAYITCTLNPEENEQRIATLVAEHPDAQVEVEYATPFDTPAREFFYAALVRKGG